MIGRTLLASDTTRIHGNRTMLNDRRITSVIAAMTILLAGCELTTETTSPTTTSVLSALLSGELSSVTASGSPSSDACSDFTWSVTQESATTYSGTFGATCAGGIVLNGTATGVLVDDTLNLTASGMAELPSGASCPFESRRDRTSRRIDDPHRLHRHDLPRNVQRNGSAGRELAARKLKIVTFRGFHRRVDHRIDR